MAVLSAVILSAADDQRLALALKAQTEFARVETGSGLRLVETQACIQAQAAFLPVAARNEVAAVQYRRGVCMLAGASLTGSTGDFNLAAVALESAIANWWPSASSTDAKKLPVRPIPSGLYTLAAIARLKAGADEPTTERAQKAISAAEAVQQCDPGVLQAVICRAVLGAGREWLGWLALRRDNLPEAITELAGADASGWTAWADGKAAFRDARYSDASDRYHAAIEAWETARQRTALSWIQRLGPPVELQTAYREFGAAQLLAGNSKAAIETLNRAVKDDAADARALYLRAVAKDHAEQPEAAMADYSLASRTAFAGGAAASGEAHLYRGILFYRRNDFAHAESEFSSALNFEIAAPLRADASAWRQLAAVASGSCETSATNLARALVEASPYFPKDEARARVRTCAKTSSARGGL